MSTSSKHIRQKIRQTGIPVELEGRLVVKEQLTPVESGLGLVGMVVGEDGDVHTDPEAGIYPFALSPEVTDEDMDSLADEEEARERRIADNLGRIVGLLESNGLPSQPQQHSVLSHSIFADVDPFASDEVIVAKAKQARAKLQEDDEPADTRFSR